MNQLLSRADAEVEETYTYDKRGNLSQIAANGQIKNQYLYGALNRLEQAVNGKGETARYEYNGLGYRVGKEVGKFPNPLQSISKQTGSLNPMNLLESQTISPEKRIQYTIDLTREYHNLLEKEEDNRAQTFLWDGNVAGMLEEGKEYASYYLQDELGSPIRLAEEDGKLSQSYGYDEFGQDLYGNQGQMQPFGYTGYQKDSVAGTYFAQAREYGPCQGRFLGKDLIAGAQEMPFTLNQYSYCFNSPLILVDLDGAWPQWMEDAGQAVGNFVEEHKEKIKTVACAAVAVAATAAVVVGTGGIALVGGAVLAGGTVGAVTNALSGSGSWQNGFLGGSLNGLVTGVGIIVGVPYVGNGVMYASNGAGGFAGNFATEFLNNEDKPINERKSMSQIFLNSTAAGIVQGLVGGGLDHLTQLSSIGSSCDWAGNIGNAFWNYVKGVYAVGTGISVSFLMDLFNINKAQAESLQGAIEACID